jgi:hypothetical protein
MVAVSRIEEARRSGWPGKQAFCRLNWGDYRPVRANAWANGVKRGLCREATPGSKTQNPRNGGGSGDGATGTRTPDLLGAIQALSQLSYSPEQRAGIRLLPSKGAL